MRFQQLPRNISLWEWRARTRIADRIHRLETIRELPLQLSKLGLKEHIRIAVDAENERDLSFVFGVLEDGVGQLVHGCDAGAAGN